MTQIVAKAKLGLLIILLSFTSATFAENQGVPVGQQAQSAIVKPKNGQTMQQVEENFGQPLNRSPAVGEPPITRWRYPEFTVYFEHNRVIHAVLHQEKPV